MLDRATLDRLAQTPARNAPILNVALAEEGHAEALLALASSPAVGPEALAVIAARVAREGDHVGRDPEAHDDPPAAEDLDRLLLAHPSAPDDVRDAVLARHPRDASFVIAAAAHPRATPRAAEAAADWPALSAAHDRPWIALLHADLDLLRRWSRDPSDLRREAAATLSGDEDLLADLAADPSRRVRRAAAANLGAPRAALAADPAPEVRARARSAPRALPRLAAARAAMEAGGALEPDVIEALAAGVDLDPEGANLAGRILPRAPLANLVARTAATPRASEVAAGLARRSPDADHEARLQDITRALARASTDRALAGRARLAAWAAAGLAASRDLPALLRDLEASPLAADPLVLRRAAALRPALIPGLIDASSPSTSVPAALVELAWIDPSRADADAISLASRAAPGAEVDLDPCARPIESLDRASLAVLPRADLSARAILPAVACCARRVRYVLAALPAWRGRLSGTLISRVLRQHRGALAAAPPEPRPRGARVENWTDRRLSELELSVALAIGHLTSTEVARRLSAGRQSLPLGVDLAFAAESRAALEVARSVDPILGWAESRHRESPAAFAIWLLLERFDKARGAAQIAGSLDAGPEGDVPDAVVEALSVAERRSPGRLEGLSPHSAHGRAVVASATARAYRWVGVSPRERA